MTNSEISKVVVLRGIGTSDSEVECLIADLRRDDYARMHEVQ